MITQDADPIYVPEAITSGTPSCPKCGCKRTSSFAELTRDGCALRDNAPDRAILDRRLRIVGAAGVPITRLSRPLKIGFGCGLGPGLAFMSLAGFVTGACGSDGRTRYVPALDRLSYVGFAVFAFFAIWHGLSFLMARHDGRASQAYRFCHGCEHVWRILPSDQHEVADD